MRVEIGPESVAQKRPPPGDALGRRALALLRSAAGTKGRKGSRTVFCALAPVSVYFLMMNQAQPLAGSESVFQTTRAEQRVPAGRPAVVSPAILAEGASRATG